MLEFWIKKQETKIPLKREFSNTQTSENMISKINKNKIVRQIKWTNIYIQTYQNLNDLKYQLRNLGTKYVTDKKMLQQNIFLFWAKISRDLVTYTLVC